MKKLLIISLSVIWLLSACNTFQRTEAQGTPDYQETKKMVMDILKTDDGKKAVQDLLKDPQIKQQLLIDDTDVQKTIEATLLDPKNQEKLKEVFENPKFASTIANVLKKDSEKLLKDLMKDPEYRQMMLDLLKDPAFQPTLIEAMKSTEFRKQMTITFKETLESPMFQDEIISLLVKANEEMAKPKKDQAKGGSGGGGQDGGGGGGQ